MKNLTIILTLVLSVVFGTNVYTQETVSKDVLLNTMNSVNSLKLSNLKTEYIKITNLKNGKKLDYTGYWRRKRH